MKTEAEDYSVYVLIISQKYVVLPSHEEARN